MGVFTKILNFLGMGLPGEIVKQVGEYFKGKSEKELAVFIADLAYSTELLKIRGTDPGMVRPMIAKTIHAFMWGTYFITGFWGWWHGEVWATAAQFPNVVIYSGQFPAMGHIDIGIGLIYVMIILFYYPLRSFDKWMEGKNGNNRSK